MNADDPIIAELLARWRWRSGSGSVELVNAARSDYLARLVMIERATVELIGENEPRRWDLRSTAIFRLVDVTWQRLHRHADPLVDRRDLVDVVPPVLLMGEMET